MLKQNLQVGRTPSLQSAQAAGEPAWSTLLRRPLLAAHAFPASALPRCAVLGRPVPAARAVLRVAQTMWWARMAHALRGSAAVRRAIRREKRVGVGVRARDTLSFTAPPCGVWLRLSAAC